MPLAQISVIPQSRHDWDAWGFAHMANHRDICRIVNTAGSGGAVSATFVSVGGGDYELSAGDVTTPGTNYWQVVTGGWEADAANCNWYNDSPPAIAISISDGQLAGVSFVPTTANPNAGYVTAAPNVGVTPGITLVAGAANVLIEYPLYPLDLSNLGLWLYQHQFMHSQMDAVLGIAGYNLLELDWTDPDQLADWINYNSNEHIQACRELGIG